MNNLTLSTEVDSNRQMGKVYRVAWPSADWNQKWSKNEDNQLPAAMDDYKIDEPADDRLSLCF